MALLWGFNCPCIYSVWSSKQGLKHEPNAILFLAATSRHSREVKDRFQATEEIQSFQGSVCLSFGSPSSWSYLFYFHREKPEPVLARLGRLFFVQRSWLTYRTSWIPEHLTYSQGAHGLQEKCQSGSWNLCSYFLIYDLKSVLTCGRSNLRVLLPHPVFCLADKALKIRLAINLLVNTPYNVPIYNTRGGFSRMIWMLLVICSQWWPD